jgi:plasmid stabilization system protein ParE
MKRPFKYKVTWYCLGDDDHVEAAVTRVDTFEEALARLPQGPRGWTRYRITQGKRFVERGDPFGPRGAHAEERGL